jgi:hypothetical protein
MTQRSLKLDEHRGAPDETDRKKVEKKPQICGKHTYLARLVVVSVIWRAQLMFQNVIILGSLKQTNSKNHQNNVQKPSVRFFSTSDRQPRQQRRKKLKQAPIATIRAIKNQRQLLVRSFPGEYGKRRGLAPIHLWRIFGWYVAAGLR